MRRHSTQSFFATERYFASPTIQKGGADIRLAAFYEAVGRLIKSKPAWAIWTD